MCQWCGSHLCPYCVGKKLGQNRIFCTGCASNQLKGMIVDKQIQQLREQKAPASKKPPKTQVYY